MRKTQSGMSIAEVLVGLAILSIMILTTITTTTTALKLTKNNVNKEFATQKAISMLEELRSLVQTSSGTTLTFLDAYDDGTKNKYILTTQGQLPSPGTTLPDDLISGNSPRGTGWLYERRISVQPVPGQGNDVRFVNVKVFINEDGQQRLLAEVASVLRTLVVDMPPSQVYDVYAVAIENVPGWWVYMSNIVPFVKTTINDLQARNPGLVFRTHWIHTLSYGRDQQYKPYINDSQNSRADINWAYFYPGKMPDKVTDVISDDYYYPWFLFQAVMNRDGTTENGYNAQTNPYPYAIADNYNNSMRYIDEMQYYNARKAADPAEELTWRLLLEQMYSNPAQFTNAIVINLHGELLPFPPVRNYSDAAKSPEEYPNVRAVTHSEQLRYTNSDAVKLRVYTYRTDPDNNATGTNYLGESGGYNIPVTVKISGLSTKNGPWTPAGSDVQIIRGGTDQDGTAGGDAYDTVPFNAPNAAAGNQMYYTATGPGAEMTFKLFHSPLKAPKVGTGGLHKNARLYGLEYIPAPLEDLTVTSPAAQFTERHLGSETSPQVGRFFDNFDGDNYSGNDGNFKWTESWAEVNDSGGYSSGRITNTSNRLQIGDNGTGGFSQVYRRVDLTGYTKAYLSFDYTTVTAVDDGDKMEVQVWDGASWHSLVIYNNEVSGTFRTDITPYISSETTVRFLTNAGYTQSDEYFNVDNFRIDAVRPGGDLPKNTARWIITIPTNYLSPDSIVTVETRLGDQTSSGVMYPAANVPPNLSRTYVWRGTDLWTFGDGTKTNPPNLPITEQFQFLGDPRHLPYADLKRPHIGSGYGANESRLGMGYNRYHDDFESRADSDSATDPYDIVDGNTGAAEIVAAKAENYTIPSGSKDFRIIINGTLLTGLTLDSGSQSAKAIADKLMSYNAFKNVARADVLGTRLRIRVLNGGNHNSYLMYDMTYANAPVFGFEGNWNYDGATSNPWPGWYYRDQGGIGPNIFGVKNDDNVDNDAWVVGGNSPMEIDGARAFQIVRAALTQSNALWTTMTGFSYYYMGIGNEIGYDAANKFTNSIPISTKPYTGSGGSSDWEQTIIDDNTQGCDLGCGVKYIRQQNTTTAWWSLYWLGELYPDHQYAQDSNWKDNGNLRTGSGTTYYVRDLREDYPTFFGTDLRQAIRRTGPRGCTTLFWGETTTSAFHHEGNEGDSKIVDGDGTDIRDNFELPVPETIPTNRPWQIDRSVTNDNPEQFLTSAYPTAHRIQMLQRYFKRILKGSEMTEGSALVSLTEPIKGKPAFIIVNGLSPTGVTGTTFIAKWSFLTLIQSYLNGGKYTDAETYSDPDGGGPLPTPTPGNSFHIRQLPRVEITEPNQNTPLKDPSTIKVAWKEKWTRWDGKRYSNAYTLECETTTPGCYTPAADYTRKHIVLVSPSNGAKDEANGNPTGWFYLNGDPAPLGARDLTKAIDSLFVNVPTPKAKWPEGNYLFRVETYRVDYPQHYSFHQYRAYIQR